MRLAVLTQAIHVRALSAAMALCVRESMHDQDRANRLIPSGHVHRAAAGGSRC